MKILVLTNKIPFPPKDGGSIATLNMLEQLHKSGFQVSCLSMNTRKHHFPVTQIPAKLREKINFHAVDCDTSVRPLKLILNLLFSQDPYIAIRFKVRDFTRKLEALLAGDTYDLVQLEGPYTGYYIPTVRKYSTARIVLRAHNIEHQIWKRKAANESNILKKIYFNSLARRLQRFEKHISTSSDGLLCISPLDLKTFRELGIEKPGITIPTGFPLEDYPLEPLPAEKSIFFIGALDWMPNLEGLKWFLVRVFNQLCKEEPGLIFHVAGRNAPPQVENMLKDDRIIFHGEVEDARQFMMQHRIMVAPLFTGSGIRIKILEAMALGRPVITTPVGIEGIPAIAGSEAIVEEDPDAFCKQLLVLLNDEEKARAQLTAAREMIHENFDTFELSARLCRFLKEL